MSDSLVEAPLEAVLVVYLDRSYAQVAADYLLRLEQEDTAHFDGIAIVERHLDGTVEGEVVGQHAGARGGARGAMVGAASGLWVASVMTWMIARTTYSVQTAMSSGRMRGIHPSYSAVSPRR